MKEFLLAALLVFITLYSSQEGPRRRGDDGVPISGPEFISINFKKGCPADSEPLEMSVESEFYVQSMALNLDAIKKYGNVKYEVIGFTDNRECSGAGCDALALRRARVVYEWLLSKGASRSSFVGITGLGSTRPIDDNETEDGRSRNRRVEIGIVP